MKAMRKAGMCCLVLALTLVVALPLNARESGKVNVNEATVEQLAEVKFIGLSIAERIVEYRTEVGPFGELDDLMKVKGIGPKTFEKIKDQLTI
ncbi:MAG: ComEA family DNA-binding protein [Thermodesulfobacteriota bacterium]